MTVKECRDVAFWDGVANHPAVAPHVFMDHAPLTLAPLLADPLVVPLRSTHGGFIFKGDALGLVFELHTLFSPEGWGREVALAAREAFSQIFEHAALVVTFEQEGYWRSRPPRSHGWTACGDFRETGLSRRLKTWALSHDAWRRSPVGGK